MHGSQSNFFSRHCPRNHSSIRKQESSTGNQDARYLPKHCQTIPKMKNYVQGHYRIKEATREWEWLVQVRLVKRNQLCNLQRSGARTPCSDGFCAHVEATAMT